MNKMILRITSLSFVLSTAACGVNVYLGEQQNQRSNRNSDNATQIERPFTHYFYQTKQVKKIYLKEVPDSSKVKLINLDTGVETYSEVFSPGWRPYVVLGQFSPGENTIRVDQSHDVVLSVEDFNISGFQQSKQVKSSSRYRGWLNRFGSTRREIGGLKAGFDNIVH